MKHTHKQPQMKRDYKLPWKQFHDIIYALIILPFKGLS